jgi:hypothetical protein
MKQSGHPKLDDAHNQEVPPKEVKQTRAGARGEQAGGNAGAMGDPVNNPAEHNYQVSRDSDPKEFSDDAARRREEIDNARMNKVYNL